MGEITKQPIQGIIVHGTLRKMMTDEIKRYGWLDRDYSEIHFGSNISRTLMKSG